MRFMLEFTDSDFEDKGWERPATCFWFDVTLPFEYNSEEWCEWDDEQLIEQASDLESEYGVHDYHASGLPDGDKFVEFGYHSYEVKQDKWEELTNKWRDWFVWQNFNPSEVQLLPYEEYGIKFFGYYYDENDVRHEVRTNASK